MITAPWPAHSFFSSEVEVTFHKGKKKSIARCATPLKYETLYNTAEWRFVELKVEEFELKLSGNSAALGAGWCWPTRDPLTIDVSLCFSEQCLECALELCLTCS